MFGIAIVPGQRPTSQARPPACRPGVLAPWSAASHLASRLAANADGVSCGLAGICALL